jgi:DNA-binding MarR family transcriptional regulator
LGIVQLPVCPQRPARGVAGRFHGGDAGWLGSMQRAKLCDDLGVVTKSFDALNALHLRQENGSIWTALDDLADDLGESSGTIERLLEARIQEGLVERRGVDRDPDYRLTRSGAMLVAEASAR